MAGLQLRPYLVGLPQWILHGGEALIKGDIPALSDLWDPGMIALMLGSPWLQLPPIVGILFHRYENIATASAQKHDRRLESHSVARVLLVATPKSCSALTTCAFLLTASVCLPQRRLIPVTGHLLCVFAHSECFPASYSCRRSPPARFCSQQVRFCIDDVSFLSQIIFCSLQVHFCLEDGLLQSLGHLRVSAHCKYVSAPMASYPRR